VVLCAVNVDPFNTQSAWLEIPVEQLGLPVDQTYTAEDLLSGEKHRWFGHTNWVRLDPQQQPAHVLRLTRD
jgi:starch synthase (maltosyl-transferring)